MSHRGPLPDSFVETLFSTLLVAWGTAFADQYKGVDMALVRNDWAHQLGGYFEPEADDGHGDSPAIRWALDHLPERPVNVMGFRKLCASYLSPSTQALPPPSRPREVPREVRPVVAALLAPKPEDAEPAHIVMAREFIARWSAPDARPTVTNQQWLAHWRKVVERYQRNNAASQQGGEDAA